MEDRTVVAHGSRKRKKIIVGMKGENVVAYGRLPSPGHMYIPFNYIYIIKMTWFISETNTANLILYLVGPLHTGIN